MRRSSILDHGSVAQCSLSLTLSSTSTVVQRYTPFPKKCASSSAQVRRPVRRRLDRSAFSCWLLLLLLLLLLLGGVGGPGWSGRECDGTGWLRD